MDNKINNKINNECIICFEQLVNECFINCNHSICKKCLFKWIQKQKITCPICRRTMKYFTLHGEIYEILIYKKIII